MGHINFNPNSYLIILVSLSSPLFRYILCCVFSLKGSKRNGSNING